MDLGHWWTLPSSYRHVPALPLHLQSPSSPKVKKDPQDDTVRAFRGAVMLIVPLSGFSIEFTSSGLYCCQPRTQPGTRETWTFSQANTGFQTDIAGCDGSCVVLALGRQRQEDCWSLTCEAGGGLETEGRKAVHSGSRPTPSLWAWEKVGQWGPKGMRTQVALLLPN